MDSLTGEHFPRCVEQSNLEHNCMALGMRALRSAALLHPGPSGQAGFF